MPSYSLLRIISSVCRKCFLLASTDAESCWLPARFEWMSSINPLRYFVVTCARGEGGGHKSQSEKISRFGQWEMAAAYRFVPLVKVVDVSIQDLDKQLDRRRRLHARVGDSESALQTLEDTLAVAI